MNKLKRLVCIIMAALIIVSAPMASYNEAQAAELAGTMEILQALFELFGVTAGLGHQPDFFSQSSFDDFVTAVSNGHVYHMDEYGDVDFSDNDSVMDWLDWANGIDEYITSSGWSSMTKYDTAIKAGAGIIDYASYKISGTSATTAMHSYIDELVSDYNGSSEALAEDIRDTFTVITGGGAGDDNDNDDDDDEETKQKKSMTRFKIFNALASGLLLTSGHNLTALVALKHPEASDFSEYDAAFEDTYFDGTYTTNADGQYSYYVNTTSMSSCKGEMYNSSMHSVLSYKIVGVRTPGSDTCSFYRLSNNGSALTQVRLGYTNDVLASNYGGNAAIWGTYSINFPMYLSNDAALAALKADDFSDAENIIQNPYRNFKENVISPVARFGKHLDKWIMSPEYLKKLPSTIKPVLGTASSSAGVTDNIDAIDDAIKEIAPTVTADPVPDDSADYSGILGKILAAINKLIGVVNPSNYVKAFASKFMTADTLEMILTNDMPVLFAEAIAEAFAFPLQTIIDSINLLPDSIHARLIELFPDSVAVGNAIVEFPKAVGDAVAAIEFKPEIKVPEVIINPIIEIPEYPAPNINIELNPDYHITVTNDFSGLGSIIATAVQGVIVYCFVPDADAALDMLNDMRDYFKFKDDILIAVDDLKTMLFGITPSPILKIPIGRPTSERYNYGTGNYIIIDISWYAPYKQLGDKIILAITWAFFLWHTFIKLPGIISGAEGSIVSIDKSYQRYERIQSYKKE